MFSREKLSVQSLCISLCFQWWVSPLKTRCRTQNKNFSFLNLKLFLFFNTVTGCLPIPDTLRWNTLARYFSHQHWTESWFSKGRTKPEWWKMYRLQTKLYSWHCWLTVPIPSRPFSCISEKRLSVRKGLRLESRSQQKLCVPSTRDKERVSTGALPASWMKETGFPSATPWARSQGNVSNNRKWLYKARSALNCLQSGGEGWTGILRGTHQGKAAHAGLPSTERDRAQPEQGLSYSQKQQLSAQITAVCPSAMSFSVAGKRQNRLLNPQNNTCKAKLSRSVIGKGQEQTTILKHNMGSASAERVRCWELPFALPGLQIHRAQRFNELDTSLTHLL